MRTTIYLAPEEEKELEDFTRENPVFKKSQLLALGVRYVAWHYRTLRTLPEVGHATGQTLPGTLLTEAAALPGLTREVIASHLVRFPAVTPDRYREVIGELLRRQASPEGLKNAEAAAYGLCKQIQAGKAISKAAPAATAAPAAPTTTDNGDEVPAEFTAPY